MAAFVHILDDERLKGKITLALIKRLEMKRFQKDNLFGQELVQFFNDVLESIIPEHELTVAGNFFIPFTKIFFSGPIRRYRVYYNSKLKKVRQSLDGDGELVVFHDKATLNDGDTGKVIETFTVNATQFLYSLQRNGGRFDSRQHTLEVYEILEGFGKGWFFFSTRIQHIGRQRARGNNNLTYVKC